MYLDTQKKKKRNKFFIPVKNKFKKYKYFPYKIYVSEKVSGQKKKGLFT